MALKPPILVVGADTKYKARVSKALAKHNGAEEVQETEAGNVVYNRQGKLVVFETTSWNVSRNVMETRDAKEITDAWISLNFLQRLFHKLVSVVCVIDLTRLRHRLHNEKSEFYSRKYVALSLLADNFVNFRETIKIVVMIKGNENVGTRKNRLREFLLQNGFEERNIYFRRNAPKVGEDPQIPLTPFILTPRKQLGICVPPVKVILFGRTGSGKSTLAQMLTLQKLDSCCNTFQASSGVDGTSTLGVKYGQGRGWYVVDTPGLGNSSKKLSSTFTHDGAIKMLEEIQSIHGLFTHFVYVRKQDRFDTLDDEIWKFFVRIFGEYIKSNFTVVITNSDEAWVETHMTALRECFIDCQSFLSADFPMIEPDDKELEDENCQVRVDSLLQLEKGLAILGRHPVEYNHRQLSKTAKGSGFCKSLVSVKDATKRVAGRAGTSTARGLAKTNVRVGKKWKRMFKSTRP